MLPFILGGIAIAYVVKKVIDSSNETKEQKVKTLSHEYSCEQARIAAQREQTMKESQRLNQKQTRTRQKDTLYQRKTKIHEPATTRDKKAS